MDWLIIYELDEESAIFLHLQNPRLKNLRQFDL